MKIIAKCGAARFSVLAATLMLGACSSLAPATVDGTGFRNTRGQVTVGCGPMQGFAGPLEKAREGCIDAYKSKGWRSING